MENTRRKKLNFLQNVSIALLSLSAVVLFAQTQFFNLGRDMSSSLEFLNPVSVSTAAPDQPTERSAPLRVAVSDTYGRYGNIAITTADEEFAPLDTLLHTALGSAGPLTPCSGSTYLNAFSSTSVYYDFLSPLPLSVIASFCSIPLENDTPIRTLIISDQGSADVSLYLWDGDTQYYRADTSAARNDLTETVGRYELGSADFAMDLDGRTDLYTSVHPCSLLLRQLPQLPILSSAVPPQITEYLLLSLEFNPNTKYRSTEASGTEVIVENDRSLRVDPNGSVHYLSGESSLLTIESGEPVLTLSEAALHVTAFLRNVTAPLIGDASLYLQEMHRSDDFTVLRFGYQVNGTPIRFSDGSYAAEATLIGPVITALDLNIRQYTVSSDTTSLLPLQQALAIASANSHAELSVGYADRGGSTVSSAWLAD